LNLRVPLNAGKLSSVVTTRDLSSSAQLHGVSQLVSYYLLTYVLMLRILYYCSHSVFCTTYVLLFTYCPLFM
jgi:hypothetical protein